MMKRIECEGVGDNNGFFEFTPIGSKPDLSAGSGNAQYVSGNKVGVVEGLEMAALYHDGLAQTQATGAKWDENGNPSNGCAIFVEAHRKHAAKIRAMKEIA